MKFKDTIGYFENAFTAEECGKILKRFDQAKNTKETYQGQSGSGTDTAIKSSIDFNLLYSSRTDDQDLVNLIFDRFNHFVTKEYLDKFPYTDLYPGSTELFFSKTFYEIAQIQEYPQNTGHYNAWHTETGTFTMSRRLFSFLLYVNDVEEGGETDFLYATEGDTFLSIKPKAGTLLVHPASFPYVHRGRTPISSRKVILTSWLSYTPE